MSPHKPLAGVPVPIWTPVRAYPPRAATGAYTYWLRDEAGEVLYVGTTNTPAERMRAHRRTSSFWPEVATVEFGPLIEWIPEANLDERVAIATARPKHNIHWNPDRDPRPWVRGYLERLLAA